MSRAFGLGRCRKRRLNAPPFSPASLFPGLGAWYDPNDLTTLFQDSAGTTPVTTTGQPVGKMLDKSGNANHATQPTTAERPTLSIAGSTKSLSVTALGASSLIFPPALVSGWTAGTVVFAAKRNSDPSIGGTEGPVIGGFGTSGSSNHYPFTDGVVYSDFLSNVRKTAGDPGDLAAWHVGDFRSGANTWKAGYNSTDYFTTATNTVANGVAPRLGNSGFQYEGLIGRVVIINRILTVSELASARAWCAAGYA